MKKIVFFLSLFTYSFCFAQSLPIDFENDVTTADFVNFDGGTGIVTTNPMPSGINTNGSVAQIVRDGGAIFAGSKIILTDNLDFSVLTKISMKVYTTAPVGTVAKFKLEGSGSPVEVDALTTVSGEWETLEWIFLAVPNNLNEIVFMFDFGNVGDGTASSTFYFDDIEQVAGPTAPIPTTLPIDFETGIVDTDFINAAGSTASIITNPQMNGINTSNTVCQIIRDGGGYATGSTIFLDNNIDLSTMWNISMKIYTTAPVGTRIKLTLGNVGGSTNLDYLTTVSGEWETASWNFDGQANDGFDRLSFLFDFGNIGDGSATSTFLLDDVQQFAGPALPSPLPTSLPIDFESSVVTSDFINVYGAITSIIPNPQIDSENPSATVAQFVRSGGAPWAQSKLVLNEFMDYEILSSISMKVYTDAPVGTLLKFKVESTEEGFANERNVNTTVSGEWATYTWDFTGDPPVYNVLTFMLGYDTPNDASANATFLFDDIEQVVGTSSNVSLLSPMDGISSYPNPAKENLTISTENKVIKTITIFDILGNQLAVFHPNNRELTIDVSDFASGIYFAKISTPEGEGGMKLIIE